MIIFIIIFLIINSNIITASIIDSTNIFLYKVLPSLFILLFLNEYLSKSFEFYFSGKLLKKILKPIFKTDNPYIYSTILFSSIIGAPSNAILIHNLYKNKLIDYSDSNKLLMFCAYINPIFVYNMATNFEFKIVFFIIPIIINLLIGICLKWELKQDSKDYLMYKISFTNLLSKISSNLFMIFTTITFSNALISILSYYFEIEKYMLGFIEISIGLSYINNNYLLFLILISFQGLAINIQIYNIIKKDLSYFKYLLGRIFSVIILLIFYGFFYFFNFR